MEDILSCDDAVLQDTYLYHLPVSDTLIRLPPLLWSRIHYNLYEYLSHRHSGGKDVITWYHRQFVEAAHRRYLPAKVKKRLHSALVDYFTGRWSDEVKPLELYKKKKGLYPNAYRGVPSQPTRISRNLYNMRKLEELPFHLIHSGRYSQVLNDICTNLEWLFCKTRAAKIESVLADIKQAATHIKQKLWEKMEPAENEKLGEEKVNSDQESERDGGDEKDADEEIMRKVEGSINEAYLTDLDEDEEEKEDLEGIVSDLQNVYDLLMLATDAIRKDTYNLPVQVRKETTKEHKVVWLKLTSICCLPMWYVWIIPYEFCGARDSRTGSCIGLAIASLCHNHYIACFKPRHVPLSKAHYHTYIICGQRRKLWSCRLKLTSSLISNIKPIIYILHL